MVFKNPEWNDSDEIVTYGYYQKYWLSKENREKNPHFDMYSGRILDLKEKKHDAINYFYGLIDDVLCDDISVCVVPSHSMEEKETGVYLLAKKLASSGGRRDLTDYLSRVKTIEKLAMGGLRDMSIHMNSISADESVSIYGEVVLLVDDVTTSGNSLKACREILLKNGAEKVAMFALGRSIG